MEDLFRNGERSVRDRDLFFLAGKYRAARSCFPMTGDCGNIRHQEPSVHGALIESSQHLTFNNLIQEELS